MGPIPAHIFWPGLVIALLTMSVTVSVGTLMAATSDGGAQPVADYYAKGNAFDETRAKRRAAEATGWQWQATPAGDAVRFEVRHADGQPVADLSAQAELRRPELAEPVARGALEQVEPGVYTLAGSPDRAGLWDLVVTVDADRTLLFEWRQEFVVATDAERR